MAFLLHYKCEYCGHETWSSNHPSEEDCPCYIPKPTDVDTTISNTMHKDEHNERYRIQFALNGYTWNNKPPKMYLGEIPHESSLQD